MWHNLPVIDHENTQPATPGAAPDAETLVKPSGDAASDTSQVPLSTTALLPVAQRPLVPKPLLIGGGLLFVVVLGFIVGTSIFRPPSAPSFGKREPATDVPLEAIAEPAEKTLADLPNAEPNLATLRGDWVVDFGERGLLQVLLSDQEAATGVYQGQPLPLFSAEGSALPPLWGLPASKKKTLLFFDHDGDVRETFEQVEIHGPDLFSFEDTRTGRRRYAHRAGSSIRPTLQPLGEEIDVADGVLPSGAGQDDQAVEGELEALWQQADDQRDTQNYTGLLATLDRIDDLGGGDARATRWRRQAERWLADIRAEAYEDVRRKLERFAKALEDRDLRALRRLWGGRLDPATSRYLTQLFRAEKELSVEVRLLSVALEGHRANAFDAQITLKTQIRRGRPQQSEQITWQAELSPDGDFASAFP